MPEDERKDVTVKDLKDALSGQSDDWLIEVRDKYGRVVHDVAIFAKQPPSKETEKRLEVLFG